MTGNKKKNDASNEYSFIRRLAPVFVVALIMFVVFFYTRMQRNIIIRNAESITSERTERYAEHIAETIDYGESGIKLAALNVSKGMTSEELLDPSKAISPMLENTPFKAIEYIRADGMNVMNIGAPFDASDRVYYIEGIKGNTGIWNNYHPKTSKDTLVNFYTPLIYEDKIVGVITGYIEAKSQLSTIFESTIYGMEIYGILIDENDMIICSNIEGEYITDLSLEKFMEQYDLSEEQKQGTTEVLHKGTEGAIKFISKDGEGRVCVKPVPNTDWKLVVVVPATSFNAVVGENTIHSIVAVIIIGIILVAYAAYILLDNIKRRKLLVAEKAKLEEENKIIDEENQRNLNDMSRLLEIISTAKMGIWSIELVENEKPRMYVDETMKRLLGTTGQERTPEDTYDDWFSNVEPEAVDSVLKSVGRMQQGFFDENTYKWKHPIKGVRYVRCGGTAKTIDGGFRLSGYHYDVDEVVRREQSQADSLNSALEEKKEYYSALSSVGGLFYSIHVIDLEKDSVTQIKAQNEVQSIVNRKSGACSMMKEAIKTTTDDVFFEAALDFTDLTTLAGRLQNKSIITKQLLGKNVGWFIAYFIMMEKDADGTPSKVIFATRVNDEEKKQEANLIYKTQTDELTGLLNRRAYEEDIYEHNDIPSENKFIYISIDVNGLKVVNDTLGHTAGDELIIGACQCMKKCLGSYGKLFRIGGDEFVAILFCEERELDPILADFDSTVDNWAGELVSELSVSYGWISKEEEPTASTRRLGAIAEERMYEAKSAYYRRKGVDRRGQQDAHRVLCELYTKILKINVTDDSFQIVNMDGAEQNKEMGFSDKISEWLAGFGKTGQVHPYDLAEYLEKTDIQYIRNYFHKNNKILHLAYRRKDGEDYKRVMMEIVPADDYTDEDQSLYLYVKSIED